MHSIVQMSRFQVAKANNWYRNGYVLEVRILLSYPQNFVNVIRWYFKSQIFNREKSSLELQISLKRWMI